MKESRYMASTELNQLMWLSAAVQALEKILKDDSTQNKSWRRWLSMAKTYTHKVINDRMSKLDPVEEVKVVRRIEKTAIKVAHYDDFRYDRSDSERLVTISQSDFLDLVDGASLNCYACPQGDVVKDCPRRKMFHRLGLQVHALRENPAPGECEFRYENEQRAVTPQYKAIKKELIDQLP